LYQHSVSSMESSFRRFKDDNIWVLETSFSFLRRLRCSVLLRIRWETHSVLIIRICKGAQESIPSLAESIRWNRFLGFINVYKYRLLSQLLCLIWDSCSISLVILKSAVLLYLNLTE
jgi:hypothetical protein